jgi:hypothetical protein
MKTAEEILDKWLEREHNVSGEQVPDKMIYPILQAMKEYARQFTPNDKITFKKYTLFQKFLFKTKLLKDPRYDSNKIDWGAIDEAGQLCDPYRVEKLSQLKDEIDKSK